MSLIILSKAPFYLLPARETLSITRSSKFDQVEWEYFQRAHKEYLMKNYPLKETAWLNGVKDIINQANEYLLAQTSIHLSLIFLSLDHELLLKIAQIFK